MDHNYLRPSLCVLALALASSGCSTLAKIFGDEDTSSSQPADTGEPSPERIAKVDETIERRLTTLDEMAAKQELLQNPYDSMLSVTQDINSVSHGFADEAAKQNYRQERFSKLQTGYTDYFDRIRGAAMAAGDPELAQSLTSTQMLLQERFAWYVERHDVMAEFRDQATAVASYRQGVFAERGEYAKLNESTCIAVDHALGKFGAAEPDAAWHFAKGSEVHVRCMFPTSIESQVAGRLSFEIRGQVNVWGSSGEGEDDRLIERTISVPVELQRYRSERYFDFAFDMGEATKTASWGYIRINGLIEWTEADANQGLVDRVSVASMRLSFE